MAAHHPVYLKHTHLDVHKTVIFLSEKPTTSSSYSPDYKYMELTMYMKL